MKNINSIGINIIRIQRPVGNGKKFSPDHGAMRLWIDDNADIFGGIGSGNQIVLTDDGFSVFHQIFKRIGLAQFGDPGLAVFVLFKSVFFTPFCDKLSPFMADGRFCFQMNIQKIFQSWEVIQRIFCEIGIWQEFYTWINGLGFELTKFPDFNAVFGSFFRVIFSMFGFCFFFQFGNLDLF